MCERGSSLIGSGDWNDGFDKVGIEGKGGKRVDGIFPL